MIDGVTLNVRARRAVGRWSRTVAMAVAAVMVGSLLVALPVQAAPTRPGSADPASLNSDRMVHGRNAKRTPAAAPRRGPVFVPRRPIWPAAAAADVLLAGATPDAVSDGTAGGALGPGDPVPVKAAGTPVWLASGTAASGGGPAAGAGSSASPTKVRVEVFSHSAAQRAGIDGVLLRLGRTDGAVVAGPVSITVDYSAFAGAYGGDWAGRLRLVSVPACVAVRPEEPACRAGTVIPARNDVEKSTVTAQVSVTPLLTIGQWPRRSQLLRSEIAESGASGPTVAGAVGGTFLALDAGSSGGSGDTSATSLQAASAWSAGTNTGEFTWSYPMRTPPSLGGPSPALNLSYSSGSVDGRTPAENNQPSWIGEGFEFGPGGFIERKFKPCAKDMGSGANNTMQTGDMCWLTRGSSVVQNLTMSLGGRGGDLIQDANNANRWHVRNEDGSLVERRTGGPNGDDNGEYFVVTATDGTQYWFGGRTGSNATWTVPVFGNHSGEPCHSSTFATSSCSQAYRWNLDYVRDPHGNTMTYTYSTETNSYAATGDPYTLKSYVRGGYLTSIAYGTRVDDPPGTNAPARVDFTVADRCVSACWSGADPVEANWSDTPWDQRCTATPCDDGAPSFYTAKRLSQVTTKVWDTSISPAGYTPVERWTLHHIYPDPQDGTRAGLFLERISHTGLWKTTTTTPDVVFVGEPTANRVVPVQGDGKPAMNWQRVKTITTEAGGIISVSYAPTNCASGSLPDTSQLYNNTQRCFPVKWTDPNTGTETLEFFHKYVVSTVVNADPHGGAIQTVTNYEYLGDAAWHYTDDDGLIPPEAKTWSVWRGYPTVRTTVGDPSDANTVRTQTETTYFRGMHGDHRPSGSHTVMMPAVDMNGDGDVSDPADAPATNDEDAYAGLVRRSITRLGVGGAEVASSVTQPRQSTPTATRTINGITVGARFVATEATYSRVALDTDNGSRPAGWRTTSSVTTFDAFGMAVTTEDRGDDAVPGDQTCRVVEYARDQAVVDDPTPDADRWLMAYPKRVRDFAVDCATATSTTATLTEDDVIDDSLTLYDEQAYGAPPVKGDITETRTLKAWNSATQTPEYLTTSTGTFDAYGRITQATDVRGNPSTTTYTPATGGPVTATTVTNHLGWATSTNLEEAWGLPESTTDPNGRTVHREYDGLGRLTKVWQPGRDKTQPANTVYSYSLRNDGVSSITMAALNAQGGYITTYEIFDSLLRPRQTQAPNIAGVGRMVTDTLYDSAGRPYLTKNPYWAEGAPAPELFTPDEGEPFDVASETKTLFDGAGRAVAAVTLSNGNEKWRTTTAYTGDRADTSPPWGGTAYSTVTDVRGRTTQLRTYEGATPSGPYDTTRYTYNRKGQLTRVEDPVANQWEFEFDVMGRQISASDPDKGTTTSTYNDFGDLLTTVDELDHVLAYTYDDFGRKTSLRDGSADGPLRVEWSYDGLTNSRGLLTKTTRWVGGDSYRTEIAGLTATYQPSSIRYTIPSTGASTGLGGSYTYYFTYNADGSPATMRLPDVDGAGGLPLEQLTFGYNAYGGATTLRTSILNTFYVTDTTYTSYGEADKITLQYNGGLKAYVQYGYEYGTRRLSQIKTSRDTAPTVVTDVGYQYDHAGNTTRISDSAATPTVDTQCFDYDHLRRLAEAWTPADGDCSAQPSAANLGGPAPYWTEWAFNKIGNRAEQIERATPLGDRTTTYQYPTPQSHQLVGTQTTDNSGTTTASYGYDVMGNTVSRPGSSPTSNQILEWDAEGHLESVQDGGQTTDFVYDGDGNRLIRRDATGTTLYLPGQEVRRTSSGSKVTTRYYTHGGAMVATRTTAGVTWLSADHHGTATATIAAGGTQATAVRRELPYGGLRATSGTWPSSMDKGFVGGTNDPTGLTHLGAREYDPQIGRFISVDPIVDFGNSQQMQGYAYSNNNPTSFLDPSGLKFFEGENSGSACDEACQEKNVAAGELYEARKAKEEAEKVKKKSIKDIIIEAGVAFLLDMFGITDIWNCISKGDIGACVNVLLNALPIGKIFSMGKAIWRGVDRIMSAYSSWKRMVSAADAVLSRADDAIALAQRKYDDVLKKFADDPKPPSKPKKTDGGPSAPDEKAPSSPSKGCHSFDPDTHVLMADGSTKPIKDVKVGEEVVVTDPETGETTTRKVTHLHINTDTELTTLTVVDDNGNTSTLETTQNHPFWDETDAGWVDAGQLSVGHKLRTSDGRVVTAASVENRQGSAVMRDLTVDEIHTYYVAAGNSPALVHNCGGGTGPDGKPCKCKNDPIRNGDATRGGDQANATAQGAYDDVGEYADNLADAARAGRQPAPSRAPTEAHTGVPSVGPPSPPAMSAPDVPDPTVAPAIFLAALAAVLKQRARP